MSWCGLLSLLLAVLLGSTNGQVVVVTTPKIDVKEGGQFPVGVKLMGETSDELRVVVRLTAESDPADFEGTSLATVFKKGAKNEEVALTFTTKDDTIPEKNETFILEVLVIKGPPGAMVGDPSKATVTILSNDNAFGIFGFADPSPKYAEELIGKANVVSLQVMRMKGLFGLARVAFEITWENGTSSGPSDISPTAGEVIFGENQASAMLTFSILPDEIPEENEVYQISLSLNTVGPTLNTSSSTVEIIIMKNDAPVRFAKTQYIVEELNSQKTLKIPVYRGLSADGSTDVGPAAKLASVNYFLVSDTAKYQQDFLGSNGTIRFNAKIRSSSIMIYIQPDTLPEHFEKFTVVLANPVGDIVLADPKVAEVVINPNDDHNGILEIKSKSGTVHPSVKANEDTQVSVADLSIIRRGGAFGSVSVKWEVTQLSGTPVTDITPTSGTIEFKEKETEKPIILMIVQDTAPEVVETFKVTLINGSIIGGARLGEVTSGSLTLEDSDDAFGAFVFAGEDKQKLESSLVPRHIQLTISRSGGTIGQVQLNYTVVYVTNGTIYKDALQTGSTGSVLFGESENEKIIKLNITASTFLSVGAYFQATLDNVNFTDKDIVFFNSPRIGTRSTVFLNVTAENADGEIGFAQSGDVIAEELPDKAKLVRLRLSREGTNGDATVTWNMTAFGPNASLVTKDDIQPWSGRVNFTSGEKEAFIDLVVQPDTLPEIDEQLLITLDKVEPTPKQKLRSGATRRKIIIKENDNPGGTFEFSAKMLDNYVVKEGGSPIYVNVTRQGGDLAHRSVLYSISPNGASQFYGAQDVMVFNQGDKFKTGTIITIDDNIPEIDGLFELKLEPYALAETSAATPAVIGEKNLINITILANDDPEGVIVFNKSALVVPVGESKGSAVFTAEVDVLRTRGTFGKVAVDWKIVKKDNTSDLTPMSGILVFENRQSKATIQITTVPDEIPEGKEMFNITLSNPTNGAKIGQPVSAQVAISKNDDAIYFKAPAYADIQETEGVTFTVVRDGDAKQVAKVKYRTLNGTALEGLDFEAINGALLTFAIGEKEKEIEIKILDDKVPEPNETFFVELYDPEGDVVVYGATKASVQILSNDMAGGVFKFTAPFTEDASEGDPTSFNVIRDIGQFGNVAVFWEIYNISSNTFNPNGTDFDDMRGSVVFNEGEKVKALTVTPKADGVPEFDEKFKIVLFNTSVVSGGVDHLQASLAKTDLTVNLTVKMNDDPHGVLGFPVTSKERDVAEDFYAGFMNTTKTNFTVQRTMGSEGDIEAVWGIYSDSGTNLPSMHDLLFLGTVPKSVQELATKRRLGTGTVVLQFQGTAGSFVSVPSEHQPLLADITTGFSISAWIQPASNTDGFIVAKTSPKGDRIYYGLKVKTQKVEPLTMFDFRYAIKGNQGNQNAPIKATGIAIDDDKWHNVLITVDSGYVAIFLDGNSIGTTQLGDKQIENLAGLLTVGALPTGTEAYKGLMQDVIIYSRKLEPGEIKEIIEAPSRKDVAPLSGYLKFPDKMRQAYINVSSLDDAEEENNEVFSIRLISAKGGARVSTNDYAGILKVLKSDNANGLFGFSNGCSPNLAATENVSFSCPVDRKRGNHDTVTLKWKIYQTLINSSVSEAMADFVQSNGEVIFKPGDRQEVLNFTLKDDTLPELTEKFTVKLESVSTADGLGGTTNISGASIDSTANTASVTVSENDHPYGLMEFGTNAVAPPNGVIVKPLPQKPVVRVAEEVRVAQLMVVRAQGVVGTVKVEWLTMDGSAVSSGASADYQTAGSSLTFGPGVNHAYINITIFDDPTAEDDKYFEIKLLNPSGGASLGIGSVVQVVISHSDDAYGVFRFANESFIKLTTEPEGTAPTKVSLLVLREGGKIGSSEVTWEITNDGDNDLVNQTGVIKFTDGQPSAIVVIHVTGDEVPELLEKFTVKLINVSKGRLAASNLIQCSINVEANDDPYGVFVLPAAMRPVYTEEGDIDVSLTITRLGGSLGKVAVHYSTLLMNSSESYLPSGVARAEEGTDFLQASGSVEFTAGQVTQTFQIKIRADEEPEADESIFVKLTSTKLMEAKDEIATNSPRLGTESQTFAHVIIKKNDNSSGVLVLSASAKSVPENFTGTVLEVLRKAGSFGEVTVKFEVIPGTAKYGLDYSVSVSDITLKSGETKKALPISIQDDNIPEVAETFTVKLKDQILGGAVLGDPSSAVITIEASDDPNGAFEFSTEGTSVEEPDAGKKKSVEIVVNRIGGTLNVVAVTWNATLNGQAPKDDISQVGGVIYFVTNQVSQKIVFDITPDDIPEGDERILITLLSATNGGRIGDKNRYTLTVLANDNPHGTVEFAKTNYVVYENATDAAQYINLTRSGGTVGDLVITFNTQEINIMTLLGETGKKTLDFFYLPYEKTVRGNGTKVTAASAVLTLQKCSEACIVNRACEGFEMVTATASCYWYTKLNLDAIPKGEGSKYYKKHSSSSEVYLKQAQAGIDYGEVTGGEAIMADGQNTALLPITIKADPIPELDEKFKVTLEKIKLKNASGSGKNIPYLGGLRTATVTVATNDDAHGSFRIYSNDPRASQSGSVLTVEELSRLAVEILVERQGGSLGDTSVSWSVNTSTSSAVNGQDFSASGATLNFKAGETRKSLTIAIQDDKLPENDETIILSLTSPTGGASLNKQSTMYIIIMANDDVGGRVGFEKSSVLAKEGDSFEMAVKRTLPAIGNVTVEWVIQGVKGNDPSKGFQQYNGTVSFEQSETTQTITLMVNKDTNPEVNEEYKILLQNITTDGVSSTGAASLDPQAYAASITIEGSNDPHGIIRFAASSLLMSTKEEAGTINLVVNRKFGAIGNIRITYDIMKGNVSELNKDVHLATPDADFLSKSASIVLENGVSSGSIPVTIQDDTTAEVDEVFIVKLTGTELLDTVSGFQPKLASTDIIAQVKIEANDGTRGVVHFSNDSAALTVREFTHNISLKVVRDQGAFGDVSVFFYTKDLGATPDKDFVVAHQDIKFADGERTKTINITIIDDSDPEPEEQFEVILASPKGGLELGTPIKAVVTIRPSDDAGGHVRFNSEDLVYLTEPSNFSTANSRAELQVIRGPGVFGQINVPFTVTAASGESKITDIIPTQGFISIDDKQSKAILVVSAIMDVLSELDETFYFDLKVPVGGAVLGNITRKTVIIRKNDSPFGLLQIYPAGTKSKSLNVEENIKEVVLDLVRTRGARDRVQVDLVTEYSSPKGAIGQPGSEIVLSKYQAFHAKKAASWHSMNVSGVMYGVLLNGYMTGRMTSAVGSNGSAAMNATSANYSMIYRWQGVYIPVQTLETDGAVSAVSFIRDSKSYLLVINEGSSGRYETNSRLYEIGKEGNASVIQDLPTKGGQKAITFIQGTALYAVILNYQDNKGMTNVDSGRYEWEISSGRFSSVPKDLIPTRGARDLTTFNIDFLQYLGVANEYDSSTKSYEIDSIVYRLESSSGRFAIHQRIPTKGAVGIANFIIGAEFYLVIANSRSNKSDTLEKNIITLKWDRTTKSFASHQQMTQHYPNGINVFQYNGETFLTVSSMKGNATIYKWLVSTSQFLLVSQQAGAANLSPVVVKQSIGDVAFISVSNTSSLESRLDMFSLVSSDSDFVPRKITMTFEPNQRNLTTSVAILEDTRPEDTELFMVRLTNPTNGAEVGANDSVQVNILPNDDAFGIIQFAADSRFVRQIEKAGQDNSVRLNIERLQGNHGRVEVAWDLITKTGTPVMANDVTPTQGSVVFVSGAEVSTISLLIRDDALPEMDKEFSVRLKQVTVAGTTIPGKGATLGVFNTSTMVIMASDSPYGVVSWEKTALATTEPEGSDATVTLHIIREQGSKGTIQVSYITSRDMSKQTTKQATAGNDYVAKQEKVSMPPGVNRTAVTVVIKHDDLPEQEESFLVNITSVHLMGAPATAGVGPSIKRPGDVATVSIGENDVAGGVIQFDVVKSASDQVDAYEGEVLRLPVNRTKGTFGDVTVSWRTIQNEASSSDYEPNGGYITFTEGQTVATINITIIDDTITEAVEKFEVHLFEKVSGPPTAFLGDKRKVTVAIRKNDSPNGMFGFVQAQQSVREPENVNDPGGNVTFHVQRLQGKEGQVLVTWRLSENAKDDFENPLFGSLTFKNGEINQTITLRAKKDDILEGDERFTISLVSADNNADINPKASDATILILADKGANGIIQIVPSDRSILIGEPSASYDGKANIVVTRGIGKFGEVKITWQITERDTETFAALQGMVTFKDGQQNQTIEIQTRDDTVPELKHQYTLEITSATGGAIVSTEPGVRKCIITTAASDYPHGLFQFAAPQEKMVSEDDSFVSVTVKRDFGTVGQVKVSYTTWSGTAKAGDDFTAKSGEMTFTNGEREQKLQVTILQDTRPEGPEEFYVNVTKVELQLSANNYTNIEGLVMDMAPEIGPLAAKKIIITKNDNAEGTLEFNTSAVNMLVKEDAGIARVPVIRTGGSYGKVSVKYTAVNNTAKLGDDFILQNGTVEFASGVTSAYIQVVILNDNKREFGESFQVKLTSAEGGASLGSRTTAVVTIDKSDYPNGKFAFVGTTNIIIPNPSTDQVRTFFLERSDGTLGKQTVHWRIMGYNDKNQQVFDTNDVSYNVSGTEVTSGTLVWADGELGQKNIPLTIKPYAGPEIQKTFWITIYDIVGSPSTSGHGEVGPLAGRAELTILKHGDPNGIVRFVDAATQPRNFSEPLIRPTEVAFPIYRREGTVGDIKVHWHVIVPSGSNNDTLPMSGVAIIPDKKRIGTIYTFIQPDDEPELTEELTVELVKVEGGAEIDTVFNTSKIAVTYNDDPHGVFAVFTQYQSVVVNADMSRSVKVNVTRLAGSVGNVRVTFTVAFDQSHTGPATSSGTIEFEDSSTSASKLVPVGKNIFMAVNSTFTITLTNVEFNGIGVTIKPKLSTTDKTCKATVAETAANSQVGFAQPVVQVDEANNEAVVTLTRVGTYGSLDVEWLAGFPANEIPTGFAQGNVLTSPSKIRFSNGEKTQSFKISVLPSNQGTPELFAIHLPKAPTSGTDGGAQLWTGHTLLKFENQGLVQFAANSREVTVNENIGTMELTLERVYGSEGSIQVQFKTVTTVQGATGGQDFTHISEGKQNFDAKQTRAIVMVRILPDNTPEVAEHFFVNVTGVVPLPTGNGNGEFPRVSALYHQAKVIISKNNYPHGLLYLTPPALSENEGATTHLSIVRTGGLHGDIRVIVRTMGAGEIFNHTGGQIRPTADHSDFVPLSTVILFKNGTGGSRSVSLQIRSDADVEQDETLVVYLTDPSGGAAILQGNTVNGQKNYSLVAIRRSGAYNGVVSFMSKTAEINEDGSAEVDLKLARTASFYDLTVEWIAKLAMDSNAQQDANMLDPVMKKGTTVCKSGETQCMINVQVKKDEIPERESSFYIILTNTSGGGGAINQNMRSCKVIVNSSDFPDGLIQFTEKSRFITTNNTQTVVNLEVSRSNGNDGEVAVEYFSWQPVTSTVSISSINVQQGVSGRDFVAKRGIITFGTKDTGPKLINVTLTPFNEQSSNVYPKVFYVGLENPTNGASLGHNQAQVLISKPGQDKLWKILAEANAGPLDNARINSVLTRLKEVTNPSKKLVESELDVVDSTLDLIIKQAENRTVPLSAQQGVMDVFCNLVNPTRDDATIGHSQLARLVERFAFTFLLGQKCQTENLIRFDHCASIRLAVAKWYPENINGYKYQADVNARDFFKLPSKLLPTISAPNKQCEGVQFLEYSSEQLFMEQKEKTLMNNKVITFKIEGQSSKMLESPIIFRIYTQDKKIAPNRAQCVYNLDTSVGWEVRQDICYVVNNLNLAVDDYVECSCKHMTSYAVKANTNNPDLIGYPIWFSVSCFICMFGLLLAVLSHHLCSVYSMFAANLLMHFCFAAFATQLCYVIDAFLSPDYLLVSSVDQDNYRCIVMGVFTHYFALAQFTWLLAQALNFWKILVLNDEHTDRKYAVYLLIGWGLPVLIVATFYVITFCLYHYVYKEDAKFIYGDVNNNGDICFITNPYAALGGVIAPALIFIMVLAVVFIQSFQVTPQWQAYDDIYRGRYNVNEVRILLLFFTIVILTWLWGGLHLAFSHVWWLVLFCIFNIIQGLYALVVYTILRNPCLPCLRPQKQSYAVSVNMNGEPVGHYPHHDAPSMIDSIKGSKISLVRNDLNDDWDNDSLTHVGGMRVKRAPPVNGNIFSIYDNKMPIPPDDDREDQDLDDLIFALKTGALTPSESSHNLEKDFDQSTTITGPHDPFMGEMRRISIADTHL